MPNTARFEHVETFVWRATEALRGAVDANACVEVTAATLLIKHLTDLWTDQYEQLRERFGDDVEAIEARMQYAQVQIPKNARFEFLFENRHDPDLIRHLQESLAAIHSANAGELGEVAGYLFSAMQNPNLNSPQVAAAVAKLLETVMDFSQALPQDRSQAVELVDAYYALVNRYEALIGSDKSQGTPYEVGQLLIALITPQAGETVYDPTCGSGGMLMAAGQYVRSFNDAPSSYSLLGQDSDNNNFERSRIGMSLSAERDFLITQGDCIRAPAFTRGNNQLQQFDVVIANNSFGNTDWAFELASNDPYDRFIYGQPPKARGDYALISHMLASLKAETGRMALVTNLGVLHRGGSEAEIRQRLIEENLVDAVIVLPQKLFPHTANASVALLFKKNKIDNKVIFVDESTGFDAGKSQNRLNDAAIERILSAYQARTGEDSYAYLATTNEIADNNYSLSINHYVRQERTKTKLSLAELDKQRDQIIKELADTQKKVDHLIRSLMLT